MKFKNVFGVVLGTLITASAGLAIGGIWGWIEGETAWQLVSTFFVVGVATIGISYITSTFFNN